MKNNILLKAVFLLILIGLFVPASYSQAPTYTCTLKNDAQTSGTVYELDIYLLRTGTTAFEMASIQFGFLFNDGIKNGGTITASWVPGSVDPLIVASGQQNTSFNTTTPGCIKIAAKLPTGGPGTGAIISNVAPGIRIGRLRLTNSVNFAVATPNIAWNFTTSPYPSKVFAYVGGVNTEITDSTKHSKTLINPLVPVELSSFVSNAQGRDITLNWETKTELSSQKFEIERQLVKTNQLPSVNGWQKISEVKAAGNSINPTTYSFVDKKLNAGKYSYRLKMVDFGGAFKYSDAIEGVVNVPKDFGISQNYPNPFNPSTRIDYQLPYDSRVSIDLYSVTGQKVAEIVNEEQSAGYFTIELNSSSLHKGLASGIYIYRMSASDKINSKNFVSVKKMIMLK